MGYLRDVAKAWKIRIEKSLEYCNQSITENSSKGSEVKKTSKELTYFRAWLKQL